MSGVLKQTHSTAEEYLSLERSVAYKSEFHDGQIYVMTGASREHNLVSGNIYRELSLQLKKRPCEAYINDMRVKAVEASSYYYPDIARERQHFSRKLKWGPSDFSSEKLAGGYCLRRPAFVLCPPRRTTSLRYAVRHWLPQ